MKPTINVQLPVSIERIGDLVISALEGGSNYWYTIDTEDHRTVRADANGGPRVFTLSEAPINGGSLYIRLLDPDEGPINGKEAWILDMAACIKGLHVMADVAPRHFGNWLNENDDAETGDVFLQCALFGEVVFG